jgi:hypothetical protein
VWSLWTLNSRQVAPQPIASHSVLAPKIVILHSSFFHCCHLPFHQPMFCHCSTIVQLHDLFTSSFAERRSENEARYLHHSGPFSAFSDRCSPMSTSRMTPARDIDLNECKFLSNRPSVPFTPAFAWFLLRTSVIFSSTFFDLSRLSPTFRFPAFYQFFLGLSWPSMGLLSTYFNLSQTVSMFCHLPIHLICTIDVTHRFILLKNFTTNQKVSFDCLSQR